MGNEASTGSSPLRRDGSLKPERIKYKTIRKELEKARSDNVNKLDNQLYSLTEEVWGFSQYRGGQAKLDLCVIANKSNRDLKILTKECQDDAAVVKLNEDVYVMGVFDGHGPRGERVSQVCTRLLQKRLQSPEVIREFIADPACSLKSLIAELHATIRSHKELNPKLSGTTATIALLNKNSLHLSWVGDSKAVLLTTKRKSFLRMSAFDLTSEHNFNTEEEIVRVQSKGGIVSGIMKGNVSQGPLRVWSAKDKSMPGLTMSKSIGDLLAHQYGCDAEAEDFSIDLNNLPVEFRAAQKQAKKQKSLISIPTSKQNPKLHNLSNSAKRSKSLVSNQSFESTASDRSAALIEHQQSFQQAVKSQLQEFDLADEMFAASATKVVKKELEKESESDEVEHCVVVIASDGVWNVMTKEEVGIFMSLQLYKLTKTGQKFEDMASSEKKITESNLSIRLCLEAQRRWLKILGNSPSATDDITAITLVAF